MSIVVVTPLCVCACVCVRQKCRPIPRFIKDSQSSVNDSGLLESRLCDVSTTSGSVGDSGLTGDVVG